MCVCVCVCVCIQLHLTLCNPMNYSLSMGFLCPWDFPGKNTGAGCHFLVQGIFSTQGLNPYLIHLLYWQEDSLPKHIYISYLSSYLLIVTHLSSLYLFLLFSFLMDHIFLLFTSGNFWLCTRHFRYFLKSLTFVVFFYRVLGSVQSVNLMEDHLMISGHICKLYYDRFIVDFTVWLE